jgi:hypothetical protein
MRFKCILSVFTCITALILAGTATASAEWYEEAGNSVRHVSGTACDAMTSGQTKWFRAQVPYRLQGHPATSRLYAVMTKAQRDALMGQRATGTKTIDSHTLSKADGNTLSSLYRSAANVKVPFIVQVMTLPLPSAVGAGMTLFDWLLQQDEKHQATANEVAVLIRDGGTLDKVLVMAKDAHNRPWLMPQILFRTTVNNVPHSYVVCSWSYPVKLA